MPTLKYDHIPVAYWVTVSGKTGVSAPEQELPNLSDQIARVL
jgi:hypothetical protein